MRLTARQAKDLAAGRAPARSEAEVQRAILAYLKTVPGVYAFRANSRVVRMPGQGGRERLVRFGVKGLPDILGWKSETMERDVRMGEQLPASLSKIHWKELTVEEPVARFIAIEVKRPNGEASPEQRAFLDLLRRAGGIAVVASSVEDVVKALQ